MFLNASRPEHTPAGNPCPGLPGPSDEDRHLEALHGLVLTSLQPCHSVPSGLQRPEPLSYRVLCLFGAAPSNASKGSSSARLAADL